MTRIPEGNVEHDVKGAPFGIGDLVRIIYATDETFDLKFMGKTGAIVRFNYSCSCGQSYPDNPMIGVEFTDGLIEEFWKEEIVLLRNLIGEYDS